MAINFGKVDISIGQFQTWSKGTFNAGELRITGEKSLGIVNNHVGKVMRIFNNKKLSHEEVLAVKQAFVNALSRDGKLARAQLDTVRSELGLAANGSESGVGDLYHRSIKPLSRQQVREILDRYAEDINKNAAGKAVIRHSDDLYRGVEEKTRKSRVDLREEINRSLSAKRGKSTDDIQLFESFLYHEEDLYFVEDDQRRKLLAFAQSCLKTARGRMGSEGASSSEGTLKLELEGGNAIEFSTGLDDAALVARLEDDIFALSNQVSSDSENPSPEEYNQAYNRGIVMALSLPADCNHPLPHDFIVMANELLAEARTLFGEGVVPKDCWIGDLTQGSIQDVLEKTRKGVANTRKLTPDDVREHVRASIREICVNRAIDKRLAEANRDLRTSISPGVFMKREIGVVEALRRAETAEQVAKIFDDSAKKFQETVEAMSKANRFVPDTMQRIVQGIAEKAGLPPRSVMAAMMGTGIARAGRKIADRIVSDGKATTGKEIAGAFRAEIEKYVNARVAILDKIDALKLGPVATYKMKEQVLSLYKVEPQTYDLEKFREIAEMLREDVQKLVALFNENENPGIEQVFEKFAPIRNALYDAYSEKFSVAKFDPADLGVAAHAIFAMIVPEDTDMPERALAFMTRKDVLAAVAQKGAVNEANVEASYSLIACTMAHGMKTNAEIAASLGKDAFPPYHAKAMVEALHELGYTSVTGEVAMSIFREGLAFTELAGKITASRRYVDPGTLKGLVKEIVEGHDAVRRSVVRQNDIAKVVGGDGEMAICLRKRLADRLKSIDAGLYGKVMEDIRKATLAQVTCAFGRDRYNSSRYGKGQISVDFSRQFVQLGGDEPIKATNFADFCDRYARFVMKNPSVKYADLGAADRRKVDIVMSFMSQTARNALANSVGLEFSPNGKRLPFQSVEPADWLSKVEWTKEGELLFSFEGKAEPRHFMSLDETVDLENGQMEAKTIDCGEGSEIRYGATIKLGTAELDRLASLDYSKFSTADYDNHVRDPNAVDPYQSALDKIPEHFRIQIEVETSFSAKLLCAADF